MLAATTKLLFENARMRIVDFRLAPGVRGGLAKHEFPTLRWQVGDCLHQRLRPGSGEEDAVAVCDKEVFWCERGSPYECVNAHPTDEYRQICWSFKQPPKRDNAQVRELLDSAIYSTDVGTTLAFENEYCRAWDFFLEPGGGDQSVPHHHVLDYCFVYVAHGRLLGSHHDGRPGLFDSINDDGDVTWFDMPDGAEADPTCAHGGKNGYDDRPMREYLVELK